METENKNQSTENQTVETNSKYLFAANHGLILGLIIGVIYLLEVFFPEAKLIRALCSVGEIATLFLVYRFIKKYREQQMGGYISYGQAWYISFLLYAFAAVIAAVFQYIHMQVLQPDYLSELFNQLLLSFEQAGLTSEQMDLFLDMKVPTPIQVTFTYIFAYILGGAFISLIMAAILRKEDYLANN